MELSKRLNLPYREGFIKNRYIGRTFIMPGQAIRRKSVRQKLNAIAMEFKGKNVLLVDDSIVRGNTSREIVQMAREAGARRVFFASAAPPVRFPNVYGIDMPTREELIACGRTEAEIAREIGCDELIYQDLEALREDVRSVNPEGRRISRTRASAASTSPATSPRSISTASRPSGATARRWPSMEAASAQLDLGLELVE